MQETELATPTEAKAKVEALFDSLALEYVREREQQFSFVSQKRIVMELLRGQRGRLLEVGCGPAIMLPDLLAMGFDVHGIDVSVEMIRRTASRLPDEIPRNAHGRIAVCRRGWVHTLWYHPPVRQQERRAPNRRRRAAL